MMHRASDPDSKIGHNVNLRAARFGKAMPLIQAQIHFVLAFCYREGLGQFPRAGAELAFVIDATAFFH